MRRAWLLLALAIALAHGRSWSSPFHFDDFHSIVDNVWLRSLGNVPRFFVDVSTFSPLAENRAYRPILLVGFALSHALGGGAPWGYHALTLALHLLAACSVLAIFRRALLAQGLEAERAEGAALVGALVFAVHPLVTEPVSYVSSRSSLQAAALSFASIALWMRGREDGRPRALFASALLLALAMATKIIAVTVPALLALWELLLGPTRGRLSRAWLAPLAPLALIAVGFTAAHEWIVGEVARAGRSTIPPLHYLLTQTEVWLRFLGLFVWPADLCADLTMPWRSEWWAGPVARAILFHLAAVAGALSLWRRAPAATLGVLWFYVALAPTNSIVPLSEPATEHRVYVALPGLVLALLAVIAPRVGRPRLAAGLAALWILGLGAAAYARNGVWQSDRALWSDVVAKAPDNGRGHLNLGLALWAEGDREGARRAFDRCAEAWPRWVFCPINRAALAIDERRLADADREISRAEALQPNNVYVPLWRGKLELERARWPEAERAFARTLEIAPGHPEARAGHAFAVFMQARLDEARALLDALARDGLLDAHARYARGWLAAQGGDLAGAEAEYRAALARSPGEHRARFNLAVMLAERGELDAAITEYEALRSRGEASPDALYNLGLALLARGQTDRARAVEAELRAADPSYPRSLGL